MRCRDNGELETNINYHFLSPIYLNVAFAGMEERRRLVAGFKATTPALMQDLKMQDVGTLRVVKRTINDRIVSHTKDYKSGKFFTHKFSGGKFRLSETAEKYIKFSAYSHVMTGSNLLES